MTGSPSFDDIFTVMASASIGDLSARVPVPECPQLDDTATKLAMALNILLEDLALGVADTQRELAERKRISDRLRILAGAAREFSAATYDHAHLLGVVARRLGENVGDICVIRAISEDGQWLEPTGAVYHQDPESLAMILEIMTSSRQRVGEGISGRVAATGRPLLTPEVKTSDFLASSEPRYRPQLEKLGVTSSMTLPLVCQGKVVGIANLLRSHPADPYDEDDLRFAESIADHAAVALGNARASAAERAAHAAAEKAHDRYRIVFESSPLPMYIFALQTRRFLAVNDAAVEHYGYSREEFAALTLERIRPPETVAAFLEDVAHPERTSARGVWLHLKKDGSIITVEIKAHDIEFEGASARLVLANDVTERHWLEEQLRQSQKMEAIGRLAGGVAHDFNNVLSVILSYGEMLFAEMKPGEPMRDDVDEIRKAGKRAAELTRQLLMFSRQQVLAPKVVDLNDVLTSMDKMFQRILGADVDLVSLVTRPLGRVRVDVSSIEQVLMNLVVNARDAMPRGGKLTLETDNVVLDEAYAHDHLGVRAGPHVMLAVTDTGTGMDRATLARIFEPFFTTKEAGKGTGLGLSTVFGIVHQSSGSIWVYSEPLRGTTFKVYLPRVDDAIDVVHPLAAPANLHGSETILLVEDDDQVRIVARQILGKSGYHVLVARSAGEAILHSETHPGTIHLLVSDVVMPQMSGPELARRLAGTRPDMRVLCMSGYTDDSIVRHGVLEAHLAYLQKPITPEALTTKVREVLESANGSIARRR